MEPDLELLKAKLSEIDFCNCGAYTPFLHFHESLFTESTCVTCGKETENVETVIRLFPISIQSIQYRCNECTGKGIYPQNDGRDGVDWDKYPPALQSFRAITIKDISSTEITELLKKKLTTQEIEHEKRNEENRERRNETRA